jgi:Na+-exporting ATPase
VHDICSDKTGTITVGKMVLKKVWTPTASAFAARGMRAPYDTANGQLYIVESGREYVEPLIHCTASERHH